MLLVLWAAWIQENARGQILLQHLEAPRIAGPKKALGNSDFTAPRYQQYHHWVQRWTQTTLTWNDIRRDLKIPIAWNRARYENFSKLARKSPSKVTQLLLWDTSCFLLNIQTWFFEKKIEKTIAHQKGFICKRSFCSPSHWPHVISCHKVLHSFIFKAIAYLPASLSTPCGLQPISWLSWSQWWALCLPWRNRLEDRCQRGALECATVPKCEVLH